MFDKGLLTPLQSPPHRKLGKEHPGGIVGLLRNVQPSFQRVKRGWVWNQFFVLEEYMGSDPQYVGKLHTDLDKGDTIVKYTLSGDGAGSIFTIDKTTGDIHALRRLDREEKPYYTLRAQAVDTETGRPLEPESEFVIKVQDINDNEPKFLDGPYTASVPEMSPVGVIRTALPNMDREMKEQYQVLIQAKDMGGQLGGLAGTTTVNITLADVNDNPPRFPKSIFHLRVPESSRVGSSVGRIKAHDPDAGKSAEIEYSIVPGDGGNMFDITTNEHTQDGILILKKPLDFETKKAYTFKVEASNAHLDHRFHAFGPYKDTATVKINILDVDEPPVFTKPSYTMDVYEDTPVGIIIGAVTAEDLDADNTAGILTKRNGYSRRMQEIYFLPVVIEDSGYPVQSSTNTLTIRVCGCDTDGTLLSCNVEAIFLPVGLSTGALIAILVCIIILLVIVVLYVGLRRQKSKETLMTSKEDIRDNVIHYDDEGGGEEDTNAFDMGTLRNPKVIKDNTFRRDVKPETETCPKPPFAQESADIRDFIHQRLQENDINSSAPPYDSLATYAYEGDGSVAESLSSIESLATDADEDYDYLREWGPRFKTLAGIFEEYESHLEKTDKL
ncbi:UNVERIFIED_CONTAM: hypothetical protein FKN15_000681 [Acipenser sinensis]